MDLNTSARSPNVGDIRFVRSGMNNAFALQKCLVVHVSNGSFTSFPPSRSVRFAPRADANIRIYEGITCRGYSASLQKYWVVTATKEADLSEKMNEIVSRRKTFSLLGLAALALAVPTTVLTVVPEEAEAQTTGMVRRQARRGARTERRQTRRTARTQRRAVRRGVAPAQ
jgi:hypothetical protein